jgi:Domain of unknown function (DUF4258)
MGIAILLHLGNAMALPQYVTETQIVRRISRDERRRFIWTKHALEEIVKDSRTTQDVEFSLTNCQVVLQEDKKDRLWRTVGTSIDGERIEAVIAVYEEEITIKVVTAF